MNSRLMLLNGASAVEIQTAGGGYAARRPFIGNDGRSYVSVNVASDGEAPQYADILTNTPAFLRKEQWVYLDENILRVARPMLRVWGELVGSGLTYNVPNGMGNTVLQHQTMTDSGNATVSMDGLRKADRDRVTYDLVNLPLPITHADFQFSLRELEISRTKNTPLDITQAEQSARAVAQKIEKVTLGTDTVPSFGGGTVYGMTNFPQRLTKTMTLPTTAGWTPSVMVGELLDMLSSLRDIFYNGPYGVLFSPGWKRYLGDDYQSTYASTLGKRIQDIDEGITSFSQADYLPNFQVIIYQKTSDVIRAVTGMGLTTVQWEEQGGMEVHYRLMCIMVPQIRATALGVTGLMHGVAA